MVLRTKREEKRKQKEFPVVKVTLWRAGKQWSAAKRTIDTTDEVRSAEQVQNAVIFSWGRGIASDF